MSICRVSGHFFHENFTDFDWVFGVSDENGTYNDLELYVLDPKLTLTYVALLRKVPILYRIGKNTQPVARVGEKNGSGTPRPKTISARDSSAQIDFFYWDSSARDSSAQL